MLAGALLSCLLAAPGAGLDLELRTEGRQRTVAPVGADPQRAWELEVAPLGRLRLTGRELDLTASYAPRFTLSERPGERTSLLHRAALLGGWRPSPPSRLTLGLEGAEGTVSLLQLLAAAPRPGQPPAPAEPVPTISAIRYRSGTATLGLSSSASARLRLRGSVAGFVEGGATLEARRSLPQQRGGRVEAGLEWDATRRDVLATALTATLSDLRPGSTARYGVLAESWRHALTAHTRAWVTAGASLASQEAASAAARTPWRLRPAGELGVAHELTREPERLRATAAIAQTPVLDRSTGVVVDRTTASATLSAVMARDWLLDATGSGGVVVGGPEARDSIWVGELRGGRRLGDPFELSLGVRGLSQRQPRLDARAYEWAVFAAVLVRHRERP
ncbi:MAG TPA: hypothetical protein VFP50_00425 [Anaeromyxobacteraceae bacterium]|nr:hypothetical protein [Anaeromyxobacteraceae bacterium]